jgi:plasmid maintenance system antidote protein VapI
MSTPEARRRLLEQAATRLGGVEQLAKKLGVTRRAMKLYVDGTVPLSDALLLRLVDLLSEQSRSEGQPPPAKDPNSKRR